MSERQILSLSAPTKTEPTKKFETRESKKDSENQKSFPRHLS